MSLSAARISITIIALTLAPALSLASYAQTKAPTVEINGIPVVFTQPPVEQSGHLLVPLRGVFERLGATVSYNSGQINAAGNGHTVSLKIGMTRVTVDGQPQLIDSPPTVIAGSTLVPLRFISQALGAGVKYVGASNTVFITPGAAGQTTGLSGTSATSSLTPTVLDLTDETPASATLLERPAISARFGEPVNPLSVKIEINGRLIGPNAFVGATWFEMAPELKPGLHKVVLTGNIADGETFNVGWTFASGSQRSPNTISQLTPAPGSSISGPLTIAGRTQPNARVNIAVTVVKRYLRGIFRVRPGTFARLLTAGADGSFTLPVSVRNDPGDVADVFIMSTSPTGAAAVERYILQIPAASAPAVTTSKAAAPASVAPAK